MSSAVDLIWKYASFISFELSGDHIHLSKAHGKFNPYPTLKRIADGYITKTFEEKSSVKEGKLQIH